MRLPARKTAGHRHPVLMTLVLAGLAVLLCLTGRTALAGQTASKQHVSSEARVYYGKVPEAPTRQQCMQCHPVIARLLQTAGAKHGGVDCRQCHLQFHTYVPDKTRRQDILPKCSRCHGHPHGPSLVQCTSCHQEAHTPLDIPASRALANGCNVCHPKIYKDIKTFFTQHTRLYCTACHHSHHGYIPACTQCHQPHRGTKPMTGAIRSDTNPLDNCVSCHPPHKALKVTYPDATPNTTCALCHRNAFEELQQSRTKHSALKCVRCHPDKHRTIKRCVQCHGEPHPVAMMKKFGNCGRCHGVAHSIVR